MPQSTLWYAVLCVPVSFALQIASLMPNGEVPGGMDG